ncbi:MAG: serine protease [Elusimicrobiales bacterium]|nr:serine protease [Elusimicrobiales bacterium]
MKHARLVAASLLLCSFSAPVVLAAARTIYDTDDRLDYYAASPELRKLADSTVAFFEPSQITGDGTIMMPTLGKKKGLCKTERFYDQPAGAFCSGFLVAPDIVATAGHCVKNEGDCASVKLVFGYAVKRAGILPLKTEPGDVYGCASVIYSTSPGSLSEFSRQGDYALIRLNRAVANHAPLPLSHGSIKNGAGVVVVGYPSGLPVKVSAGASVRLAMLTAFLTNLDAFGGNSGSAVFNAQTHLVEGIYAVGGDEDYVKEGDCYVTNVVLHDKGASVATNISFLFPYLKAGDVAATRLPETIPAVAAPVSLQDGMASKVHF